MYDSFLSEFPLCHGYWRKYAAHKAHLCTLDRVAEIFERAVQSAAHKAHLCTQDKVVEIFERAVQSATYCVSIWVEFCRFGMSAYKIHLMFAGNFYT